MIVWAHRKKSLKNYKKNVCSIHKKVLPLRRYPENNLFTLKKTNTY